MTDTQDLICHPLCVSNTGHSSYVCTGEQKVRGNIPGPGPAGAGQAALWLQGLPLLQRPFGDGLCNIASPELWMEVIWEIGCWSRPNTWKRLSWQRGGTDDHVPDPGAFPGTVRFTAMGVANVWMRLNESDVQNLFKRKFKMLTDWCNFFLASGTHTFLLLM